MRGFISFSFFLCHFSLVTFFSTAFLTLYSNAALAGWYVGVDTTNIRYEVGYNQGNERYDVNPNRFKIGHLNDEGYGFEFQVYGNSSDQSIDPFGDNFEVELGTSYGLFSQWSSTNKHHGFYGLAGFAYLDTTYRSVAANIGDTDSFHVIGLNVGWYYRLAENLKLTLDYTQLRGNADYPTFITGSHVSPIFSGFGFGLKYNL